MKKKRIQEKMGGGARIGLGGMNSTGPYDNRHTFKHPSGYHTGGYAGNADSQFSQRQSLISTLEEENDEYKEDQNMLEEEDLMEFFARIMKMPLTEEEKKEIEELDEKDEEEEVSEMSAGGVAGVATPLGTDATGKLPSKEKMRKQLDYFNSTYGNK
jgi:hypothetical protein